ncbi:hypothetical protein BD310DRAFT_828009 [Dichomitus squalens]|uniref:F-box domain-containing protein n=1 Tax=Dichomitus squalens TaxID=114155 RepID=A0A4Q9PJY9_9APHY|nr:hypothetical protein BD310DRAFT_828009 [Dichomitus squalens]
MDYLANSLHSSPSVSSTAQSPALPWEVIERTIDHCSGDHSTLRTIALTCSQLHPRSVFVPFTDVYLRSEEQITGFYNAVQAQPYFQPVVQFLSFPWPADDISPFPLLSFLPGHRHLTFDGITSINTDDIQLLHATPFATGLLSLTIRGAWFRTYTAFLQFLSAFPNIENLTCERISIYSLLNVRKTISWSDEFSRCFRPLSENWALTKDIRYCEWL